MKFQCPHCNTGFDLTESGRYECPICQNKFNFTLPEPSQVNALQLESTSDICPFCQMEIPAGASKCGHCGEWVSGKTPKSNTIYLLLSFLFGHFGIAEFYAERIFLGISYLVFTLLFLGISAKHPQAIIGVGALCIIQFLIALFIGPGNSSINTNARKKKTNPFVLWISILFALAFIGISVWHLFFN